MSASITDTFEALVDEVCECNDLESATAICAKIKTLIERAAKDQVESAHADRERWKQAMLRMEAKVRELAQTVG
jgi:uncharacterized protein YggL (DUF469 family)